jgi:hypothetical protein
MPARAYAVQQSRGKERGHREETTGSTRRSSDFWPDPVGRFRLALAIRRSSLYAGYFGITEAERLKAITDTRTALLAGLIGVGTLGTFWINARAQRFTAESIRVSQENLRLTERNQEETFRLAQRGHLTDRYSKAIEQIGDGNLDVRLGGIYALEQLATDSQNARDQGAIVEVLAAFVRVHSAPLYQYTAAFPDRVISESPEERQRNAFAYVTKFDRLRPAPGGRSSSRHRA